MRGKFIIFSAARCGSTTLVRCLNCHPDIECIQEPFNPRHFSGSYLGCVSDVGSLDDTLRELWTTYDGIKHVWHSSGWPFEGKPELNRHLLLNSADRLLFLNRKNALRRIVSHEISLQTGVWSIFGQEERARLTHFPFRPLDIPSIKAQLLTTEIAIAEYRELLDKTKATYLDVCYEQLYDPGLTLEERDQTFNRIVTFVLGKPVDDERVLASIQQLCEPLNTRLNSEQIYRLIPGIDEVEQQCGAETTGWLFG
jgi:hypothetical protein